jgi:hypothetical protein
MRKLVSGPFFNICVPRRLREPLEVKIVNAGELKSDKVLHIKRGDDGKLTGATVMNVT